jgi:hypothetical protein
MAVAERSTASDAVRPDDVPVRGGISGAVVPVRLGVALGAGALAADAGLLGVIVGGRHLWRGVPLAAAGFGLSGYAAYLGIYGVIRYGLFTEGCGAGEVADELKLSKVARAAGITAEVALLTTAGLSVALVARALA